MNPQNQPQTPPQPTPVTPPTTTPPPTMPTPNTSLQQPTIKEVSSTSTNKFNPFKAGLKWWEYLICGLPFVLIVAGGAIGGGIGVFAFWTNVKVWKSDKSIALKLLIVVGTTIAAFVVYFIAATFIISLLKGE